MMSISLCFVLFLFAQRSSCVTSWSQISRREAIGVATAVSTLRPPDSAVAAAVDTAPSPFSPNGLASKLAKKDPALLKNSVFNIPPAAQIYPEFMRGTWMMNMTFGGFLFPSTKISRDRLPASTAGFQKCSVVPMCDIGVDASYIMKTDEKSGLEDRSTTLTSAIDGFLKYRAVSEVLYDAKANPNRLSIDFVDYKTKNAERIELFCNARESELYYTDTYKRQPIFVCSEYVRQVTFSASPDPGVARQATTNYAHYWTYKKIDDNNIQGNVLTCAYLDPQEPLFFEEPNKPVAIYSHVFRATRQQQ